jgi:hypothetical protein
MPLSSGARLGPYEILTLSGSVGRRRKGTGKKERSEMKRRVLFATVVSAAVVLAGATLAYAQQTTTTGEYVRRHVVTVAFPFTVGGKQLPAGKYSIEQPTRDLLIFQEEKKDGARVQAPVISRLPAPATPITESKLLFDKVGNTHYLSEVWFRGVDGFLLYSSKEAHTRVTVKTVK